MSGSLTKLLRLARSVQIAHTHTITRAVSTSSSSSCLRSLQQQRQSKFSGHSPTNAWHVLFAATAAAAAVTATRANCDAQVRSATPVPLSLPDDPFHTPPSSSVLEPKSGVSFPSSLDLGDGSRQALVGASVRTMRKLVQVYAIGVYVAESTSGEMTAWREFRGEDLASHAQGLWTKLSSPDVEKVLRVVVVRSVAGKHMGDGFKRALKHRAKDFATQTGGQGSTPPEVKQAVDDFCTAFKTVGLMKEGSVADISLGKGGVVTLTVDGRLIAKIKNRALSWALADMYIGQQSVVSGLREEVAKGVFQMLKRGK